LEHKKKGTEYGEILTQPLSREAKNKNRELEDLGKYVMIYCGVPNNQWATSGAAIERLETKIKHYTWISDRIILTNLETNEPKYYSCWSICPAEGREKNTE